MENPLSLEEPKPDVKWKLVQLLKPKYCNELFYWGLYERKGWGFGFSSLNDLEKIRFETLSFQHSVSFIFNVIDISCLIV